MHAISSSSTAGRGEAPSRALARQRRSGRVSGGSCVETSRGGREPNATGGPRLERTEVETARYVRMIGVSKIDPRTAASARHAVPKLLASWLSSTKWRNTMASTITSATRRTGPSTGCFRPRSSSDRSRIMVGNRNRLRRWMHEHTGRWWVGHWTRGQSRRMITPRARRPPLRHRHVSLHRR